MKKNPTITVIQQPRLKLIVAKAESFPDGNKEAFDILESHLSTLKDRKFYGLCYPGDDGEMGYYAGLVPHHEIEERKFADLGFATREVEGGPCARVKMLDWLSKTDQIGPTFGEMIEKHGIDPSRPMMEFYRSMKELHLLLPVVEG